MTESLNRGLLQDLLIISGLIGVQVINAAYMVLVKPVLSGGLNPLFIAAFGSLTTSICILPFAIAFEKKRWPSRLSAALMVKLALIALGGVTASQALMFLGVKKTSPAMTSAMPNVIPGVIFIIAACLRFERVDIRCTYSRVKITGTIICLGGAVAMSVLQSPSAPSSPSLPSAVHGGIDSDWIQGCLCLLGTVLVGSCSTVLMAVTMVDFPAPFTLCAMTSSMGAVFTVLVQFLMEGKVYAGPPALSISTVAATVLMGGSINSVCIGFQTWAVRKKGPVLASMFSPIQTVSSVILSALILGQVIKLGSVSGMFAMFFGLYMVLWAMKKEGSILPSSKEEITESWATKKEGSILPSSKEEITESIVDIEKPLLS